MSKTHQILINFDVGVDLPPGFERMLQSLLSMVTQAYERDNPTRTMWPAGSGSKPLNVELTEFDPSVFCIDIAERAANERELERRK